MSVQDSVQIVVNIIEIAMPTAVVFAISGVIIRGLFSMFMTGKIRL